MSINITEADFRKALFGSSPRDGLMQSMPLSYLHSSFTYDGTWICNPNAAGQYRAFQTGFSVTRVASNTKSDPDLIVRATLKTDTDSSNYMFFMEPHKGGYADYQGIDNRDGSQKVCRSRNNSAETTTNISDDWTVETEFMIYHEVDDSNIYFYIDGAQVAAHTTNISSQPYEIGCGEPNGLEQNCYLKYPPGIVCYA